MGGITKRLVAAGIGLGAGLLLLGGYCAARTAGVRIPPDMLVASAAALVFAGAVAVFALFAMDRPSFRKARAALPLNEDPAKEYIYYFRGPDLMSVTARPDQAVGEMLVRFGDAFKETPEKMKKAIVITLKGSPKKPFATVTLQQLFAVVKAYNVEHVLLLNEKDEFVGYIPGKRAVKEFAGDKAMEAIDKYLVKVLLGQAEAAILRELGGATSDDTIDETDNALNAQARLWANEKVQGLILHHRLKPVGFISRIDILRLNSGLLYASTN